MTDHRTHAAGAATAPDGKLSRPHHERRRNPRRYGDDANPPAVHRGRGFRSTAPPRRAPSPATPAHAPAQRHPSGAVEPPLPQDLTVRREASGTLDDGTPAYMPLSRTTDRVLRILLEGDLSRLRAESVAESLGISCTTLRRRLRSDHTNYQFLLDRARQYRCESRLRDRWLPGKCLADELGYLEVNSFYRAFRRWTGLSYSAYRQAML
jgi:AraC-like DNA-binding protein